MPNQPQDCQLMQAQSLFMQFKEKMDLLTVEEMGSKYQQQLFELDHVEEELVRDCHYVEALIAKLYEKIESNRNSEQNKSGCLLQDTQAYVCLPDNLSTNLKAKIALDRLEWQNKQQQE